LMILESCPEVALLLERIMDGWPAISDRSRARNDHDLKRKEFRLIGCQTWVPHAALQSSMVEY